MLAWATSWRFPAKYIFNMLVWLRQRLQQHMNKLWQDDYKCGSKCVCHFSVLVRISTQRGCFHLWWLEHKSSGLLQASYKKMLCFADLALLPFFLSMISHVKLFFSKDKTISTQETEWPNQIHKFWESLLDGPDSNSHITKFQILNHVGDRPIFPERHVATEWKC